MEGKHYSIKEAAEALEVSPDTIRRRIKKGELKAEMMEGPYGQAYYIAENELFEAAEIKEVIPFNRPLTEERLKQVIKEAVSEEVSELRQEVAELRQLLEEARMIEGEKQQEPEPGQNFVLVDPKKTEEKKQPWWKRLFKKK